MQDHGIHLFLFGGCMFRIDAGVQEPKFGTLLLARHLDVRDGETVLELGAGVGIAAILAARRGARVIATDIVPASASCTLANAHLNGVAGRVEARIGDLFAPVEGLRFDLIATNPPQMPTPPGRDHDDPRARADNGGPDGWVLLDRILAEAPAHLVPGGRLTFTLFSFLGVQRAVAALEGHGLAGRVVAREPQPFPRIGFERLDYIRGLDAEGTIRIEGGRVVCDRLVLSGTRQEGRG